MPSLAVKNELDDLEAEARRNLVGHALDFSEDLLLGFVHGPINKKGGLAPTFRRNTESTLAEPVREPQSRSARPQDPPNRVAS